MGLRLPWWMNEIPSGPNIMRVCVRTASRPVESLAPVKKKTRTVNLSAWWRLNREIIYVALDYFLSLICIFCLSQNIAACRSGVPRLTPAVHCSGVSALNSVYRNISMFSLNCSLWSGTISVANKQRGKRSLNVWLAGRKLARRNAEGAFEKCSAQNSLLAVLPIKLRR